MGLSQPGYADGRRATLDLLEWEPWSDVGESVSVPGERYSITAMGRDITQNG